jgi:membrane peptidoglycan carboxypeptidase
MAAAFQIFGNNGYYFRPHAYYKVTNNDGTEVLLKSGDDSGDQFISESSAGVMRNLLKTVTRGGGTGAAYGVNGFETFAKTGTTSDDKDRWFVAGTPYYVAAVWYGYDQPRRIWNVSGNPAGRIYKEIMDEVHKDLDDLEFPNANGVVARSYCTISGDIASGGCPRATGYYKSSNVPNRCKGCSIINGIGQGIPSVIPNTKTTAKTTTDKDDDKTTKPTQGGNITKPTLPKPSQVTSAPTTAPTTQATSAQTQAPEPIDPPVDEPFEPDPPAEGGGDSGDSGDSGGDSGGEGSIEEQVERMIRHSRQKH